MSNSGLYVTKVDDVGEQCELWRLHCPMRDIEDLRTQSSKYSPTFEIGGVPWRIHLQIRTDAQTNIQYLAVHLQYLGQGAAGTFAHFMITVCNADPNNAKQKTFHCHFKKSGSAWGLHHFIPLDKITNPQNGFIDYGADGNSPALIIDVVIRVLEPDQEGAYQLGSLPQPVGGGSSAPYLSQQQQQRSSSQQRGGFPGLNQQQIPPAQGGKLLSMPPPTSAQQQAFGGGFQSPQVPALPSQSSAAPPQHPPSDPLQFPFDEALCDMAFALQGGITIKAHRCIISCRVPGLCPQVEGRPLPKDSVVEVAAVAEVFRSFLRYVYTEQPPERTALRPEYMVDLYLLAMEHDLLGLAEHTLHHVSNLLTPENLLPIIASRFDANDDMLNAVYLRGLTSLYDRIIEDPNFESLPGPLNRRLSLILRGKEGLPTISFPRGRIVSLSTHLGLLAESGNFWDYEIPTNEGTTIKAHAFVLASRAVSFNQAFYKRTSASILPDLTGEEFSFSRVAWQRFVCALYRGTIEQTKDINAEDVAIIWKANDSLGLDGKLRKETEIYITDEASTRLLVYAERYNVAKLKEISLRMSAACFRQNMKRDPSLWEVVAELSQPALLALFRATMTEGAGADPAVPVGAGVGGRRY